MPAIAIIGAAASVAAGAGAIAAAGGIAAMSVGAMVVAGAQIVGGVLSIAGTITKNPKLTKIGAVIGIAGMAAGAISGQFGSLGGAASAADAGSDGLTALGGADMMTGAESLGGAESLSGAAPNLTNWSDVSPEVVPMAPRTASPIGVRDVAPQASPAEAPSGLIGDALKQPLTQPSRLTETAKVLDTPATTTASTVKQAADEGLISSFLKKMKENPELVKVGSGALEGMAKAYGGMDVEKRRQKALDEARARYNRSIINAEQYRNA